jgi:hypothetical protein
MSLIGSPGSGTSWIKGIVLELVFPSHPERRVISTKKTTEDARRCEDGYEG